MKKIMMTLAAILLVLSVRGPAAWAFEAGLGLTTWCAWWEPVWKRMAVSPVPGDVRATQVKIDPMVFYVPMVTLRFSDRWSLAGLFLYGNGRARSQSSKITYTRGGNVERYMRDVERYDSDLTLNYAVTGMVKVFAGFKFQGYRIDEDLQGLTLESAHSMPYQASNRLYSLSYGAGFGTAVSVPLRNHFYWTGAVSLLLLGGSERYYRRSATGSIGWNITTGFAYYAEAINTSLSAGFRYQGLHYYRHGNTELRSRFEQVYGVSASAQYFFDFTSRKGREVI